MNLPGTDTTLQLAIYRSVRERPRRPSRARCAHLLSDDALDAAVGLMIEQHSQQKGTGHANRL